MTVRALGYVIVTTTKATEWDRFMTDVVGAMRGGGAPDGVAFYRIDDRPFRFWVQQGHEERLTAAAYDMGTAAELEALAARIVAAGRPVEHGSTAEAAQRGVAAFFRTSDPAGNGLEFFHGDIRDTAAFVSPVGVGGFVTGEYGMGHAVFSALNFEECHAFYKGVIGFGDTDIPRFYFRGGPPEDPGMGFAFMHADNGRHHSIALGEGPVPPSGCVHLMLEMTSMSDVGRCHDRMRLGKVPESATLGRHINDQTTGFYMETPSGFDLEIGYDSLVIDPANWQATRHTEISEWGHVWAWQTALRDAQAGADA